MMNEQDRDLILALASGSLSEQDAVAARARVEADPELAAEYAAQKAALDAIAASPDIAMTASERSQLRGDLLDYLNLDVAPVPLAPPIKRKVPWWQPVMGIAAAAVFVTAIVIVPGMVGGSDDFSTTDAALEPTSTAAATAQTESEDQLQSGGGESGAEAAPEEGAFDVGDGQTLEDAVSEFRASVSPKRLTPAQINDLDECLDQPQGNLPPADQYTPIGVDPDTPTLVFLKAETGDEASAVVTIDLSNCAIVDIDN